MTNPFPNGYDLWLRKEFASFIRVNSNKFSFISFVGRLTCHIGVMVVLFTHQIYTYLLYMFFYVDFWI